MDGIEKLFLIRSLFNANEGTRMLHGFMSGFMSCVLSLTVMTMCYNTCNTVACAHVSHPCTLR